MDKSPEAFRTISEVADSLDLPQHVLRFWETRFPQIKPMKRGGGRRYYRPDDVELLRAIKRLLYDEGYTIKGVQKMLREQGASLRAEPAPRPSARVAEEPPFERIEPAPPRMEPLRPEPVAPRVEREPAPVSPPRPMPAPRPISDAPPLIPQPAAGLGASELAELRAILADLREAERVLTRAR